MSKIDLVTNRSIVEVLFKVHAIVRFGEEVRVSGNVPELGCNNPERAVPLVTNKEDYPSWSSKKSIFLPGENGLVVYRYCVFAGGVFRRWEGDQKFFRTLHTSDLDNNAMQITEDFFGDGNKSCANVASSSKVLSQKSSFKTRQYEAWNLRNKLDINLNPETDAVIIVSYFLPVILSKSEDGVWSARWDEENVIALQLDLRTTWVGSVRYKDVITPADEEKITDVLLEMSCNPLFLDAEDHHRFYDVFCKTNIWPVLHHIADVYGPLNVNDKTAQAQQDLWITFNKVNTLFRNKVVEVFHEGELIWVQGFHLMCLPAHLRRKLPLAKIGLFFHTPFPSSEIWRTEIRREDLLSGVLSADQVGFHLYEYGRHFISACRRMLGFTSEVNPSGMLTINANGREVAVTNIHVGIDLTRVEAVLKRETLIQQAQDWKKRFPNRVIIAVLPAVIVTLIACMFSLCTGCLAFVVLLVVKGIDRLERLKGIPLKLLAIEKLLEENPQYRSNLIFVMIGVSAQERQADYRQTQHDVKLLVEQINAKYGETGADALPVIYFEEREERAIALEQRLAFFAASDILMSIAPRDGLNRMPIEYTIARARCGSLCQLEGSSPVAGAMKPNEGLVILSEFVSSARVMRGSIVVNPYCIDLVKDALKRALEMNPVDRSDRHRRNMEYSLRLTTTAWAMEVLRDLKRVQQSCGIESVGLGAGFRVLGVRAGFHQLDMTALTKTYRVCSKRLILLDWGGTLVQEDEKVNKLQFYAVAQGHASRSGPSAALTEVLEGLCSDPKNIVFVVSGKEIHAVTEFFGRIRGLNLGAEHGYYYYWSDDDAPAIDSIHDVQAISRGESKWRTMVEFGEHQWKESVKMMMDVYVERTHGTYIEQKGHALIWQFRDADPEFGYLQSKELQDNLAILLANFAGVDVIRGGGVSDGYIEVRPSGISKGLFLEHVMSILKSKEVDVDFVLTVGDDISDEPMFDAVESILSMKSKKPINAYSVTVGKKSSAARAYVDDPAAVMEMLVMLNKAMKTSVSPRVISCDLRTSKSELILNTRGAGSRPSSDRLALAVDARPTLFVTAIGSKSSPTTSPIEAKAKAPILPPISVLTHQSFQHRRISSNKSFDRLAIEIQASTSATASRSQLWQMATSVDEHGDDDTENAPEDEPSEEGEQDAAFFF